MVYEVEGGGFVRLIDSMGDDLRVVNSARVSFGKEVQEMREADRRLLSFLAHSDPPHTSPFRHAYIQVHIRMPEFVARQFYKHIIGSEYSFRSNMGWNEISGRYIPITEFWTPPYLRLAPANKKQGSIDVAHPKSEEYITRIRNLQDLTRALYLDMLNDDVAAEQARTILPISFFTEFWWTASLQAFVHFCKLRNHPEAQKEIRLYAEVMEKIVKELFPDSSEVLMQ